MKQLKKIHVMAIAMILTMAVSGSAFASNRITSEESTHLDRLTVGVSTDDFDTLSGLSADPMSIAEMEVVIGQAAMQRFRNPQDRYATIWRDAVSPTRVDLYPITGPIACRGIEGHCEGLFP